MKTRDIADGLVAMQRMFCEIGQGERFLLTHPDYLGNRVALDQLHSMRDEARLGTAKLCELLPAHAANDSSDAVFK